MATIEELTKMGFAIVRLNPEGRVICDYCNTDFTDSDQWGGVLFNHSAYCPQCAGHLIEMADKYGERHYLTFPKEREEFRAFVYRIRKER